MEPTQNRTPETKTTFRKRWHRGKALGQSFIEFALAIPVLMTVVYGLLEVGRALFIYSSTVTAARQAVRYGAVTGISDNGIPRFQDCASIRAAAQRVAFVNDFADNDISIEFDSGPGTTPYASCAGVEFLGVNPQDGDRLLVTVATTFSPVVPFIPLDPMTISSSSSRTMVREVAIQVTAVAVGWEGESGEEEMAGGSEFYSMASYDFPASPTPTLVMPTATTEPPTATLPPTITNTPLPTNTATTTSIYSPTPSQTPTATFTPTNSPTPTMTGTATSTATPTNTPIVCNVSHSSIYSTGSESFGMMLYNNSDYSVHYDEIMLFFNTSSPWGQSLIEVQSGGLSVWTGDESGSPVTINTFNENGYLAPWSITYLEFQFSKNYTDAGSERILLQFQENGCTVIDSSQ